MREDFMLHNRQNPEHVSSEKKHAFVRCHHSPVQTEKRQTRLYLDLNEKLDLILKHKPSFSSRFFFPLMLKRCQ